MTYLREREILLASHCPKLSTRKDHSLMPLDERLLRMPEDLVRPGEGFERALQNASVGTKRASSDLDLTDRGERNQGRA
jgi:hypothetical protein